MSKSPRVLSARNKDPLFEMDLSHKYLHFRRTKIVATVGPATKSPKMLKKLIARGVDVIRINFSHGDSGDHVKTMRLIRKISARAGRSVAILADLCGPKIRVGMFRNDAVTLRDGSAVKITTASVLGDETLIPSQYKGLVKEARVGDAILLDDGNLELKVMGKSGGLLSARVVRGGVLKNKKGMNLPDTPISISALTKKDRSDLRYCVKGGADYIALSFVRSPKDILELRSALRRLKADTPIIAKIEKPEALANIRRIVSLSDGIMVARGDLGVELPTRKIPFIQSKLIAVANESNKPVIVATQMLESMIEHSRPTRAEVTDVSSACLAGTDAVMMSAETAAGKYPLEAFDTMDSILRETEAYQFFSQGGLFRRAGRDLNDKVEAALGTAAAQLSRDLMVRAVFVLTRSGYTARMIASDRPAAPIIALTTSERVAVSLNLVWGVYAHLIKKELKQDQYLAYGEKIIKKMKLAAAKDHILMLSGVGGRGAHTNSIVVHRIS